eukprot:4360225-Amphidinium_carterae.1
MTRWWKRSLTPSLLCSWQVVSSTIVEAIVDTIILVLVASLGFPRLMVEEIVDSICVPVALQAVSPGCYWRAEVG